MRCDAGQAKTFLNPHHLWGGRGGGVKKIKGGGKASVRVLSSLETSQRNQSILLLFLLRMCVCMSRLLLHPSPPSRLKRTPKVLSPPPLKKRKVFFLRLAHFPIYSTYNATQYVDGDGGGSACRCTTSTITALNQEL